MGMLAEIKTLLATISNVYIGDMPATPDDCVSIYPLGGGSQSVVGGKVRERYLLVQVRSSSYATGLATCETINGLLHAKVTGHFLLIAQEEDVTGLGKDASGRNSFTTTYRTLYL